jgi:hypothetical protein
MLIDGVVFPKRRVQRSSIECKAGDHEGAIFKELQEETAALDLSGGNLDCLTQDN